MGIIDSLKLNIYSNKCTHIFALVGPTRKPTNFDLLCAMSLKLFIQYWFLKGSHKITQHENAHILPLRGRKISGITF